MIPFFWPLTFLLATNPALADDASVQAAAESAFDNVMSGNAVNFASPAPAPAARSVEPTPVAAGGEVEVPLERFESIRRASAGTSQTSTQNYTSLVALGGSTYTGRATPAGLELNLSLDATLRGAGTYKTVPLVGTEVAIVQATVNGKSIPVQVQHGYQVWVTDAVGEVSIELNLLVPAAGPRGSLEYDFLVPRTPVTRFDCSFPELGIEPRLNGAVREDRSETGGNTSLSAWLAPTSRIHLVGFRDLGEAEQRTARLYAETLSLVSVEERTAQLFTVVRYAILEAGARNFDIQIPPGFSVVSADGAGGFRYRLDTSDTGTILRGETPFPIRDTYEVSLRLEQNLATEALHVEPPHALGAEREHGWIGLEAIGSIQVDDRGGKSVVDIGVSQLPAELVQNAVSPVLEGWRYHEAGASIELAATALPEREPAAGAIDSAVVTTTLAPEGGSRTTMRLTLRNRLRHSLGVRLPPGVEIRACRLDGETVVPSRGESGTVRLPLKRSVGSDRPVAFTLEVEWVENAAALGLIGWSDLELPAVELPISSLEWTVLAPSANRYTRLYGDIAPQEPLRKSRAHTASLTQLDYRRYWVAADAPVRVSFAHVRGWLRAPLGLVAAGLLASLAKIVVGLSPARRTLGIAGVAIGGLALAASLGGNFLLLAVILSAVLTGASAQGYAWVRSALNRLRQPTDSPAVAGSWRGMGWMGRGLLLAMTAAFMLLWLGVGGRLLYVLSNPW